VQLTWPCSFLFDTDYTYWVFPQQVEYREHGSRS
jgi:hypothetical protein